MSDIEDFLSLNKISGKVISDVSNQNSRVLEIAIGGKTRLSKFESMSRDLALALKTYSVPIITPIYESGIVRVSFLNKKPVSKQVSQVLHSMQDANIIIPVGFSSQDKLVSVDLHSAPHVLVGGTTGSGKSMWTHSVIQTLLHKAAIHKHCKLALIDPKSVEYKMYAKNPFVMGHADSGDDAVSLLEHLASEMENRYKILSHSGHRSIKDANAKKIKMPYIVCVIDELADLLLTNNKRILTSLTRIVQKSRAAGIHIVAAMQNPSAKILSGDMKANFPVKIAFKMASSVQSRVLLDMGGAENLLGQGDALISGIGAEPVRFQSLLPDDWSGKQTGSFLNKLFGSIF